MTERDGTGSREGCGRYADCLRRQPCSVSSSSSSSGRVSRGPLNARPDSTTAVAAVLATDRVKYGAEAADARSCGGWFVPGLAWVHRRCGRFCTCPPTHNSPVAVVYSVSSLHVVIVDCFSGELPVGLLPSCLRTKIKIDCTLARSTAAPAAHT